MDRKEYAAEFARSGGVARAKSLTRKQRRKIARRAARARWNAPKNSHMKF